MARKASYEEPVDYLETEEINEEAAAAVADLRAARRRIPGGGEMGVRDEIAEHHLPRR